ncbi:tyr_phosphatase_2 domain-containing protein, partial [Haematococcus lacustris]
LYTSDIPEGVAYAHIHLVAKELPPPSFVDEVCRTAQHFWAQHPEDFIAVHCAYGFNRTGFVMACYLVQVCGLSVDEALDAFKASRPPGVKHDTFRQELFRRAQYLLTSGQLSALQLEGLLAATTPSGLQPAQGPEPGSRTPGGRSPARSSLPVPDRSLGAIKWQTEAVQAQHDAELDLVVKTMEEA